MRTSTSWAKGQSGNPSGRPASATRRLAIFDKLVTDDALANAINALVVMAAGGDLGAIKYLLDRVLGPTANLADVDAGDGGHDLLAMLVNAAKQKATHDNT